MVAKKRDRDLVVLSFVFSILLFVGFVYASFYAYNEIIKIKGLKTEFSNVLNSYNELKKQELSYGSFIELVKNNNFEDEGLKLLLSKEEVVDALSKVDKNFYNNNFINSTGSLNYIEYLDLKKSEIENSDKKEEFIKKEEKIFSIIPLYADDLDMVDENGLTNFKFINYLENLLRKFNLNTDSSIGISQVMPVSNKILDIKNTQKSGLNEASIYYIPLKLDLVGSKAQIIKFFNYLQASGSVKTTGGELIIENSNQLTEAYSLEMKEYIDNSTVLGTNSKTLQNLILNGSQSNDKFEVKTQINFYVVGVPAYKLKEQINLIIGKDSKALYNYYTLLSKSTSLLKSFSTNASSLYVKDIKKINSYLGSINADIVKMTKEVNSGNNLDTQYKNALKYKEIFILIDKELVSISNKLNLK